METIQIKRQEDGRFIRLQECVLPGRAYYPFFRRYVTANEKEYELVGNFQCKFLCELRRANEPYIHICLATDTGEGTMQIIDPTRLLYCGKTVMCQHICQHKKDIAKDLLKRAMTFTPEQKSHLSSILEQPTTLVLNPEVLNCDC